MRINIRRGLDLPLSGAPQPRIGDANPPRSVALLGADYLGLKPTLLVAEGDRVKLGQPLFIDKGNPAVYFTAPGAGTVTGVRRGARRSLHAVEIRLEGDEEETFNRYAASELAALNREQVKEGLLSSGLWTALRTRPYSRIPDPATEPEALFVTAMDTNPLAAPSDAVIAPAASAFLDGLSVLARLTSGTVHLCQAPGARIPVPEQAGIQVTEFEGPHPAGLVGTHIHFLAPVGPARTVWHVGYQDVIAIGRLFTGGRLVPERIVSLAGPAVRHPRLVRTRLGASTEDLVAGELDPIACRVISGSVLGGRRATDWAAYLGRYHSQVSVLAEGQEREFLGWLGPGARKFSANRVLLSSLFRRRRFAMSTTQNGSPRAMVPIGAYERVMPLKTLPTQLLRALLVRDIETAKGLGALELDEEDLALCSFVCPSKYDYGPVLRANLALIEREG